MSFAISAENRKNAELKHEIDDIKYRLKVEWVNYRGNLYLFDNLASPRGWEECLHYCGKKPRTGLICFENADEAKFASAKIKKASTDYWTAVHMVGSRWVCAVDKKPVPAAYWDTGRSQPNNRGPATKHSENCVIITKNCQHNQNCWHDLTCNDKKRCICKLKPNKKWMT
ncbi:E-selectin [Varanus komodoensis]|nr:E-selectin [Varanus komodoensis]